MTIRTAVAEIDILAKSLQATSVELRRAQATVSAALIELARVRRELRELDADLTPVRQAALIEHEEREREAQRRLRGR